MINLSKQLFSKARQAVSTVSYLLPYSMTRFSSTLSLYTTPVSKPMSVQQKINKPKPKQNPNPNQPKSPIKIFQRMIESLQFTEKSANALIVFFQNGIFDNHFREHAISSLRTLMNKINDSFKATPTTDKEAVQAETLSKSKPTNYVELGFQLLC